MVGQAGDSSRIDGKLFIVSTALKYLAVFYCDQTSGYDVHFIAVTGLSPGSVLRFVDTHPSCCIAQDECASRLRDLA